MKEIVSSTTPMSSVVRVLKRRVVSVAMGETMSAWLMERPPMKAYSRCEAPGKMLLAR